MKQVSCFAMKHTKGFTLLEVLVVMGISAVMLTILTQVFFSSLRGNNKATLLSTIKQDGINIVDMLDKNIRNSDVVLCPVIPLGQDSITCNPVIDSGPNSSSPCNSLVISKNGSYTRYRFVSPTTTQNGQLIQDVPVRSEEEAINDFTRRICGNDDPLNTANQVSLTNINTKSGVSLTDGIITRGRLAGFKDIVTINFKLGPPIQMSKIYSGQIDPVPFDTSVELR